MFGVGGFIGLQLEKFEVEKRTALQNMLMETNKFDCHVLQSKVWHKEAAMMNNCIVHFAIVVFNTITTLFRCLKRWRLSTCVNKKQL